jgi:hypothetical protein
VLLLGFFRKAGLFKIAGDTLWKLAIPGSGASHTKISAIFSTDCNLSCSVSILSLVGQSCNCFIRENVYRAVRSTTTALSTMQGEAVLREGIFAFLQIVSSLSHRRKIVSGNTQEQQSQTDWKQLFTSLVLCA